MNPHRSNRTWEWNRGPIGRLIKMAHVALRREMEAMTRRKGLTSTQWSALGILHHFPGLTHSDLEMILQIEKPSVTSLVIGMERKGWIERRAHPRDARSKQLFLTESGRRLAEETRHFADLVDAHAFREFTEEEKALLRRLLEKLIRAVHPPDEK